MTLAVPHSAGQDHGVHSLHPPSVGTKAEHNRLECVSSRYCVSKVFVNQVQSGQGPQLVGTKSWKPRSNHLGGPRTHLRRPRSWTWSPWGPWHCWRSMSQSSRPWTPRLGCSGSWPCRSSRGPGICGERGGIDSCFWLVVRRQLWINQGCNQSPNICVHLVWFIRDTLWETTSHFCVILLTIT